MASITIDGELEDGVSSIIQAVGYSPYVGIVRQVAPDIDPNIGELLHGAARMPFISISAVLPETPIERSGFAHIQQFDRPITVALIGNKTTVENDHEAYRLVRQKIIARLHQNRYRGSLTTEPTACLMKAVVRTRSRVDLAAWVGSTRYVSAFDVIFRTHEPTK